MGGRGRRISEFKASLVYRVSSRTARATQRNPVSKNQKLKKKKRKKENNNNNKKSESGEDEKVRTVLGGRHQNDITKFLYFLDRVILCRS